MEKKTILLLAAQFACAASLAQAIALPPDSPRWQLEGNAKVAEAGGRPCLMLNGAAAAVKDFELRDGVIEADVHTSARRGFFGFQFRMDTKGDNGEWVYLRQHKSGLPDAMQYTPVLGSGLNWQLYSGPGFIGPVDIPLDTWFRMRLEVSGAQARLFVKEMDKPVLVMPDLKSGRERGEVGLAVLTGATCFANVEIRPTPDTPWQRRLPPMPPGAIERWEISPSLDALARDLDQPLARPEAARMQWQAVQAEPPGLVALYRYRAAPHLPVSFANDASKRLEPQKGMQVVYARTTIDAQRAEVRRLDIGYSDDVRVFLNGRILWRGRSAQYFRDPGFLGIVDAENDAVYLPLRKGRNELVLAVSELGGGWGFVTRLDPAAHP
ncbi:hypothetical protein [Ramlibacter albus]|uniref:DUF1080 domain-containing protein n=1 Tax=Ramlibacter albus TaxID=2079448 RepID=A0A923M6H4_9BURK|nr:hypothetical protein [Ramlibacter albus]MBC5764260.1 hypothetical protein [Ramlibacter albus]